MYSKSSDGKKVKYSSEKRKKKRVLFDLDVFYPHINNKSVYAEGKLGEEESKEPALKAVNLSETGIGFKSKLPLTKGDFISFLMKVGDAPSFHCLAEVKWVGFGDDCYLVGCEFAMLSLDQINTIRAYVDVREALP